MNSNNAPRYEDIINGQEYEKRKRQREDSDYIANEIRKFVRREAEDEAYNNADEIIKVRIKDLESKCMKQEIKLKNCMPMSIILPFVFCICAIAVVLTVFTIQILTEVKLIEFYLLFYMLVILIGLLHTSWAVIRGWRRFLSNE